MTWLKDLLESRKNRIAVAAARREVEDLEEAVRRIRPRLGIHLGKQSITRGTCSWWKYKGHDVTHLYVQFEAGPYRAEARERKDGQWVLECHLIQNGYMLITTLEETRNRFKQIVTDDMLNYTSLQVEQAR